MRAFTESLPKDWKVMSFGDMLTEPVRNGIYKSKDFHGRGARVVNMGELFGYEFISDQEMKRVEITDDEVAKFGLKDGDLLFARRSLVLEGSGKCSLVVTPRETTTFESSIIRARPNRKLTLPKFLFYLFASPLGRSIVASIATQTAVSGIRGSDLSLVALPLLSCHLSNGSHADSDFGNRSPAPARTLLGRQGRSMIESQQSQTIAANVARILEA